VADSDAPSQSVAGTGSCTQSISNWKGFQYSGGAAVEVDSTNVVCLCSP
jgi:hypothetical protein